MTNYHFVLFVCIMELQLLNADLMQTRKLAIFLTGTLASASGMEGGK